ncbi:hypothetical protein BMS3Bbin11_00116 [bacterium BMS3Bbin11]|nr:hypothetical protein BMS3Bbin11_00116 [bacterium BMS3Bbin11]
MPVFARGTGLGNRLFNWARAQVYAEKFGIEFISPIWFSLRFHQVLEAGSIHDTNFGLFASGKNEHGHYMGVLLKIFGEVIPEPIMLSEQPKLLHKKFGLIQFSGVGGDYHSFIPIAGEQKFLCAKLTSIVRPKWKNVISNYDEYASTAIGVHIRYGRGFREAEKKEDIFLKGTIKTPSTWFVDTLKTIRDKAGFDVPVLLVSDGALSELAPILKLRNIKLVRPACPISDLLLLSRTRLIVGSGGSSFSAWASYLGEIPTFVHPGQCLSWFGLPKSPSGHVCTFDPANPDGDIFGDVGAIFKE